MILVQAALAHERMGHRQLERLGEGRQFLRGACRDHAAACVEDRPLGARERRDNALGGLGVDRGPSNLWRRFLERVGGQVGRENVHRHVDQHGTGPSRLGQMEGAVHDPRQIRGAIDAIDALAERPVNLELTGVLVQVHFLVRMASLKVRLHVSGDDDHRDRVERRVGHAGGGVGQARAEMRQHHTGLPGGARIAVGGMRRNLFMSRRDELDPALAERVEQRDHRVTAQTKDHLHAQPLEVVRELVRGDARACSRLGAFHRGLA